MKIESIKQAAEKVREYLQEVHYHGGTRYFYLHLNNKKHKITVADHSGRIDNNNGEEIAYFVTIWNTQDINRPAPWAWEFQVDRDGEVGEGILSIDEVLEFILG